MPTLTRISPEDAEFLARQKWLRENKGILTRIAERFDVSGVHVSKVFRKIDRNARIEAHLAEIGAPGFEAELQRTA
jgi:hypothetical protein